MMLLLHFVQSYRACTLCTLVQAERVHYYEFVQCPNNDVGLVCVKVSIWNIKSVQLKFFFYKLVSDFIPSSLQNG